MTTLNPKDCPKYLPADNPARIQRDATIGILNAEGMSQVKIAAKTGLDKGQVSRILSQDRQKEIIDQAVNIRIAAIKGASCKLVKHVHSDDAKISLAAIGLIDKSTGISGAHTPPVYIGKLYQQNNTLSLSPDVLKLLAGAGHEDLIEIPGYDDEG